MPPRAIGAAAFLAGLVFKLLAVPFSKVRARVIRALQECQQRLSRRRRPPHLVVHQYEFLQLGLIERLRRAHRILSKPRWLRRRVSIKRRSLNVAASRPKSHAAHLVRIRLSRDRVGSLPFWSAPPREARHRQIETAPEKMHRTGLSDKARAKLFEHFIAAYQNPPEPVGILRIVGSMLGVLIERNRIRDFDRHLPDFHGNPKRPQCSHEIAVKPGNRLRRQGERHGSIITGSNDQLVMEEIELYFEIAPRVRNGRRSQPRSIHVEGHPPPMIDIRAERQPHFTHDLRPHVERRVSVLPSFQRKFRPEILFGTSSACIHISSAEIKQAFGCESRGDGSGVIPAMEIICFESSLCGSTTVPLLLPAHNAKRAALFSVSTKTCYGMQKQECRQHPGRWQCQHPRQPNPHRRPWRPRTIGQHRPWNPLTPDRSYGDQVIWCGQADRWDFRFGVNACAYSCSTTLKREVLICRPPLYLMKPNFLNLFMKKLTRERVVPTISASVSCDIFGRTPWGWSSLP